MKTEYNKITIAKPIFTKQYNYSNYSNIKQKNINASNSKREENNSSILNRKNLNLKQNKLNINKKLNLIKIANESQKILKYSENKRNVINRQLNQGNSKSYIMEESSKTSNIRFQKNDNKSLYLKKHTLQTDPKISEKLDNIKLRQSKSITKDSSLFFPRKKPKEKELSKNPEQKFKPKQKLLNNIHINNNNDNIKKPKLKLVNRLNLRKADLNSNNNLPEDIFIFDENKPIILTKEEQIIYGNRTMKGYNKIRLLGKGGYGIVWECQKNNLNNLEFDPIPVHKNFNSFAVKQTSKKNYQSHLKEDVLSIAKNEINILKALNDDLNNTNNNNKTDLIPKIFETSEDSSDIWFSFEKGGISLSSLTFNIKGIFEKGERIYQIQKGEFLILLFKNISQFKYLIRKVLEGIDYINKKGIIHSDIKPENILVQFNKEGNFFINSVKIVDYGSAFYFNNKSPLITNTPEYLCPEIMTNDKDFIKELNNGKYINCIDIWSFGISILELCLCCPIWMSYKTKNVINGKIIYSMGYFGCKGRDENKIYQKQIDLSKGLNKILKNSLIYMMEKNDKNNFIDLLSKMLCFDYTKRINTDEALNHPFFGS